LRHAVALHQSGDILGAQEGYDSILLLQPRHFDALHLSGVIAAQNKNPIKAIELIARAIAINANSVEAFVNLGIAHQDLSEFAKALVNFDLALILNPQYAQAHRGRGIALQDLHQTTEAIASYDRAIVIDPTYAEAHSNRGNALQELLQFDEAILSYDRAIVVMPQFAQAHHNRGNAFQGLKQFDEAVLSYDRAIVIDQDYAEAFYNRGVAFTGLENFPAAIASYDRSIILQPTYAKAHGNRGNALQEMQCFDEAILSYDKAILLEPDYAEVHNNRANALHENQEFEAAMLGYDKAILINPNYVEAYVNRGTALQDQHQFALARLDYNRAIELNPLHADAHWNKSLLLLLLGEFDPGWSIYEWRWKRAALMALKRNFPQPLWLGSESLVGKTILLHAEQGFGDIFQFCRYVELVAALGAQVILEIPVALMEILSPLLGVAQFIVRGNALPAFDYHCPLLSLPLAFHTDLTNIPSALGYLESNTDKVLVWQARLGPKTKPRVGLVWSGNALHKNDRNRSLLLEDLMEYLPSDYQYVCLQQEIRRDDEQALEDHPDVLHFGCDLENFSDTAAVCQLMDIVISVDTSVAHLAAGLGKPVWLLLPYSPDWRWLLERNDSPWYPSVALYRQMSTGDWVSVFENIRADLLALGEDILLTFQANAED